MVGTVEVVQSASSVEDSAAGLLLAEGDAAGVVADAAGVVLELV